MHHWSKIFAIVVILIVHIRVDAQDIAFAQPFAHPQLLNPALTGNTHYQQLRMVYRNQWLAVNSPYVTYGVTADRYFHKAKSGLGLSITYDSQGQGIINYTNLDIQYAYNALISNDLRIRGGIQVGGIIKSQNTSKIIYPDMIDLNGEIVGSPNFSGKTTITPNFATGIVATYKEYYGGISVHHLFQAIDNTQDEQKIILPRKYTVFLGTEMNLIKNQRKKYLWFSPNIVYQKQGDFHKINLGMYLSRNSLVAGLWIRNSITKNSNTVVFIAGYTKNNYSFAYSYDFSLMYGGFEGIKTSSHEVTFAMHFEYKNLSKKKIHTIKSPRF